MLKANRHCRAPLRSVCVGLIAWFASCGAGPAFAYEYYPPEPAMRVVNGYLAPVAAGTVVSLALSTAPSVVVASTTTAADGTWHVSLDSSGTYDVTIGGSRQAGQFICLGDLIPTPTPTSTP